jgi:polyisoprenoid-binding protein YceI
VFPFNKIENSGTRRIVLVGSGVIVLAAVAVIALVVISLLRNDNPNLATDAPFIPVATNGVKRTGLPAAYSSGGTLHFVIDSGSNAKYVAREQLALVPVPTNAVGVTKDVTGDLYLSKDGLATGQKSGFKVDVRTLVSDESLRDRQVKSTMGTDNFPFAEFIADSVTDFPKDYSANQQVQLTMKGMLNVHGATKPVEWAVFARAAGDYLTAVADTDIKMTDFGVNPPTVSVSRVEDKVHLQVTLYAKLSN